MLQTVTPRTDERATPYHAITAKVDSETWRILGRKASDAMKLRGPFCSQVLKDYAAGKLVYRAAKEAK